jgi:hypothetical protein
MTTVVRQGDPCTACLLFRVILEPFDSAQDRLREESRLLPRLAIIRGDARHRASPDGRSCAAIVIGTAASVVDRECTLRSTRQQCRT